jgi:hypothetical protein
MHDSAITYNAAQCEINANLCGTMAPAATNANNAVANDPTPN